MTCGHGKATQAGWSLWVHPEHQVQLGEKKQPDWAAAAQPGPERNEDMGTK